jgi:hypothetical protein
VNPCSNFLSAKRNPSAQIFCDGGGDDQFGNAAHTMTDLQVCVKFISKYEKAIARKIF